MMKIFRVTATALLKAESPALAKDALSERIDLDALPCDVEIEARELSSAPSHGENHPMALTFHCLNNALQVLRGFDDTTEWLTAEVQLDARRLVEEGVFHLAELQLLFIRQERVIEEMRVEMLADRQQFNRVEATNSALVSQINIARAAARATVEHLAARPLNIESLVPRGSTPMLALERAQ